MDGFVEDTDADALRIILGRQALQVPLGTIKDGPVWCVCLCVFVGTERKRGGYVCVCVYVCWLVCVVDAHSSYAWGLYICDLAG